MALDRKTTFSNNKKIFITHCSAKKNTVFKNNKAKVTPDKLYTATPTQRFMNECKDKGVNWAIFSDKYGVWFSNIQHEWYQKNPNKITKAEFNQLVSKFNKSLGQFDEIWFYHNPGRFHRLYKKLLKKTELKNKIKLFTHLNKITEQVKAGRHQDGSETCKWLHEQLESLPVFRYPFDLEMLPKNGVYFFYEEGENSKHGKGINRPRIVRIGTHKENNFRSRISEHFLLNESKMKFTQSNPKPSDRSIFRKNIGMALLNKHNDLDYLKVWEIDFTSGINRANHRILETY
jgi:predicted peroxiredoxin